MLNIFKKIKEYYKPAPDIIDVRKRDPLLDPIFSSHFTDGRSRGSGGLKLYENGKVTNWSNKKYYDENKKWKMKSESEEKKISEPVLNQIIDLIKNSGIMEKECPRAYTFDVVKSYTIYFNGKTKSFGDPSGECEEILRKIDSLIWESFKK